METRCNMPVSRRDQTHAQADLAVQNRGWSVGMGGKVGRAWGGPTPLPTGKRLANRRAQDPNSCSGERRCRRADQINTLAAEIPAPLATV